MTVSIGRISIDYYLESAAAGDGAQVGTRDLTAYYTEIQAPAGRWWGKGLAGAHLAVDQQVEKWAAKRIYEDFVDPETGETLGRRPIEKAPAPTGAKTPSGAHARAERDAVAGFDLTFSVPKSVSVLWALAGSELQGQLYGAHKQAVEECLSWLESNVAQARAGHGGVAKVAVKGVIGSLFDHWDSRAGDPQLHTHAVLANRVQRVSDGEWVTLDSYTLHRYVVAVSEMYNSILYDRIAASTGAVAELRDGAEAFAGTDAAGLLEQLGEPGTDGRNPRAELSGVPDGILEEFSSRSAEIEAVARARVQEWEEVNGRPMPKALVLKARQEATLTTRTAKAVSGLSLPEKMLGWRKRSMNAGYSPDEIIAAATGHAATMVSATDFDVETIAALGGFVLADAGMRRATFMRANLMASAERILRGVRMPTAAGRHVVVARVVEAAVLAAVPLSPERFGSADVVDASVGNRGRNVFDQQEASMFTTRDVFNDEAFLIGRTASHGPSLAPDAARAGVAAALTREGHHLSADQARAAEVVLSNGKSLDAVIGPAGTGKTTTMKAIRDLWEARNGEGSVVGLAPSAVAAAVLGEEIDAPTENVAKWLYESVGDGAVRRALRVNGLEGKLTQMEGRGRGLSGTNRRRNEAQLSAVRTRLAAQYAEHSKYQLRPGQLLIVDEGSMVGTAALAELARQAEVVNAKVLLVGDPSQLEAVDAGGFLGWMERNTDAPVLDSVWRFRAEWERSASLRLRRGEESVLTEYMEQGRITGCPDGTATDLAYQAWLRDTQSSETETLLIAGDNETVGELNIRAQLDLATLGTVNLETTVPLRTGLAGVGDVILARQNNRQLKDSEGHFVKNGTRLAVSSIADDGSVVATRSDTGATITLDRDYLAASVELGYACTAHRAQGVTVDRSHTVVREGEGRELFYVAMTRGRESNVCYVDLPDVKDDDSPDEWGMMHTIAPDSALAVLAGVLKNERAEKTAHEVQDAEHGYATDLGRMIFEYDYVAHAARATSAATWARETFGEETAVLLRSDPLWPALVGADPATTIEGTPATEVNVAALLSICQEQEEATLCGVLKPVHTATVDQESMRVELVSKIRSRLNELTSSAVGEDPEWMTELTQTVPADRMPGVLDAVVAWRAVSGQADAETAWGLAPKKTDATMCTYYALARAALPPVDPPVQSQEDVWEGIDFSADMDRLHALDGAAGWDEAPADGHTSGPADEPERWPVLVDEDDTPGWGR